jgi:hypothetical protein
LHILPVKQKAEIKMKTATPTKSTPSTTTFTCI